MPVERKPLFRAEIVAPRAAALAVGDEAEPAQEILRRWAQLLASSRAEEWTESELLPDFLTDVFYRVLGYNGPTPSGGRYTLSRERRVEVDGKFADAVIGDLGASGARPLIAVEGKGPRDPLDRPFAGRRMSAVDQAYRYAINLPCDWILVTNLREIRLYHKSRDQRTFERFDLQAAAEQETAFRQLIFVLGAERVVPAEGPGHLDDLLKASERAGIEMTGSYYAEYSRLRREILSRLREANPGVLPESLLLFTQKLLDRVLFIAFAEDRGLLPPETLRKAYQHQDPYNPRTKWETFQGLFRAIDAGSGALGIPGYNGGLFARDPLLDRLEIPDDVLASLSRLGDYNYRSPDEVAEGAGTRFIDVEILGHIFEQSITDLERLGRELAAGSAEAGRPERRRREGAFYTPRGITRFIVGYALHRVLADRFETLRLRHLENAARTAVKVLDDPRAYDPASLNQPQREALIRFWDAWPGELERVRILDPACGSGAFLIEAFDQLHEVYQEAADRLYELRGSRWLFDPDRTILEKNLYGVDLNEEAIQICRLSIWIKTAQRGKRLTDLDHTIRTGNSLVDDPEIDPRSAFDWQAAFPEVTADGGFDVVIGNPPYVRQELLGPLKPYLERRYQAYHGMADLYVYFFEKGLGLLKPGGRLSFVVTNKWLKAAYAEPLRRLLTEAAWLETLVDLGHAKEVFEEADVMPSILVLAKPLPESRPPVPHVSVIPRADVRLEDLGRQVEDEGFELPRERLGSAPWTLEPSGVDALMAKLRAVGTPLAEFAGVKPFRGVLTGLNEAFLIDTATRGRLVTEDPRSTEILRPYLRGQDVRRWRAEWEGLWMIFSRRGIEIERYPAILQHLERFRERLEPKPTIGDWPGRKAGNYKWYEIQDSIEYHELFDRPKIFYQEIQYHPAFCLDVSGLLANNKVFFIPVGDLFLLAVLNSPLLWWYNWRTLVHLKDEALSPSGYKMEKLPIAVPSDDLRRHVEERVGRVLAVADESLQTRGLLADWLAVEHEVAMPTRRWEELVSDAPDALVAEVRRARGKKKPLSAAALRSLRDEHARTIAPLVERLREAERMEAELSDLVCQAYGLTPAEIELVWRTAPPRMPVDFQVANLPQEVEKAAE
jgi:SAM-dependent methyltransferase